MKEIKNFQIFFPGKFFYKSSSNTLPIVLFIMELPIYVTPLHYKLRYVLDSFIT